MSGGGSAEISAASVTGKAPAAVNGINFTDCCLKEETLLDGSFSL